MRDLFASPHLVDLILVLTLIEAAVLYLWHRRTGRGIGAGGIASMLLPGVFLLLALRAALADAVWPWMPATLAAALIAHLSDVRTRARRRLP